MLTKICSHHKVFNPKQSEFNSSPYDWTGEGLSPTGRSNGSRTSDLSISCHEMAGLWGLFGVLHTENTIDLLSSGGGRGGFHTYVKDYGRALHGIRALDWTGGGLSQASRGDRKQHASMFINEQNLCLGILCGTESAWANPVQSAHQLFWSNWNLKWRKRPQESFVLLTFWDALWDGRQSKLSTTCPLLWHAVRDNACFLGQPHACCNVKNM